MRHSVNNYPMIKRPRATEVAIMQMNLCHLPMQQIAMNIYENIDS